MRVTRLAATGLGFLALANCAIGPSPAARARTELIGMTRAALEACAGPGRAVQLDEARVALSYAAGTPTLRGSMTIEGGSRGQIGILVGGAIVRGDNRDPAAADPFCEARFILNDGRVERVDHRLDPIRPDPEAGACSDIVYACLERR